MFRRNSTTHLRSLIRRVYITTPSLPPPPPPPPCLHHFLNSSTTKNPLYTSPFFLSKTFCTTQKNQEQDQELAETSSTDLVKDPIVINQQNQDQELVEALSVELLKDPDVESLDVVKRLELSFSHVSLTSEIVLQTLNLSNDAGRGVLGFLNWVKKRSDFEVTDEVLGFFVDYFGRRKDFKATHDLLVEGKGVVGGKCFECAVDRLVRAGRPTQTVSFFERMESDYGFVKSLDSLKVIVSRLCDHGFASYAEKMVKNLANEFFPDEYICDMLIKGWCVDDKFDEAVRFSAEMYRGGFELSTFACNEMLDCVCRLSRKKDPFRLKSEAEKVLYGMEEKGIPRDVETFNVLISNLCKIRKTEDAMKLFHRMGEWGCHPNETTFIVLVRSLYQAARVGEGDEMIDRMKSAGYGFALDKKEYYGLLKILCGIERIDHAMSVFAMMKADGCEPGIKTYDLLMGKLVAHGRVDKANDLFKEAANAGLPVEPKAYKLDPRFAKKKPTAIKKEKKRETLPEKMARKRRRLKQIRLSFVKKPKRMTRRAY